MITPILLLIKLIKATKRTGQFSFIMVGSSFLKQKEREQLQKDGVPISTWGAVFFVIKAVSSSYLRVKEGEGMKPGAAYFQRWVTKNRMLLWWMVFLPLMLAILLSSWDHLTVPVAVEAAKEGFWATLLQSPTLVTLARVVMVALGVVIIMICLFFPALRVGKEGVYWTREKEEELTQATGEIIGAEVEALVAEEKRRWSLVYKWLRLAETKKITAAALFRELVAALGETFPQLKMKIALQLGAEEYTVLHPLLRACAERSPGGNIWGAVEF